MMIGRVLLEDMESVQQMIEVNLYLVLRKCIIW